jgi:hypothetical protein
MSTARRRLEELRAIDNRRFPPKMHRDLREMFKQAWSKPDYEKFAPHFQQQLPSLGANSFQELIQLDFKRLCESAELLGWKTPFDVVVGFVPFGGPNAYVERYPDENECLIVLSEAMYLFLYQCAKLLTMCFPLERSRDGIAFSIEINLSMRAIDKNPSIKKRFQDILTSTLFHERGVLAAEQFIVDPNRLHCAVKIADLCELFVLGHEYGHLRDHDASRATSSSQVELNTDLIIDRNWLEEMSADSSGASLAIQAGMESGIEKSIIAIGLDFCFTMMDVLCRSVQVARGESEHTYMEGSTHPPFSLRRALVRHGIRADFERHGICSYGDPGETVESIGEYLWKEVKPSILQIAEQGTSLSAFWDTKHDSANTNG